MVHKKNGHLQLNDIVIPPGCTLKSLSAIKFESAYHIDDMGTGWKWLRLAPLKLEKDYARFSFGFSQDQLTIVSFVVQKTPFENSKGWEDFNETVEKEKALQFDDWLTENIGAQRNFPWGTIEASFDPRSASSSISINYDSVHKQYGRLDAYEKERRNISTELEKYLNTISKNHSFTVKWTFAEYGAFKFYKDGELLTEDELPFDLRAEIYDVITRKMGISRHADEISKGEGSILIKDSAIQFKYQITLEGSQGIKTKSDTIKLS